MVGNDYTEYVNIERHLAYSRRLSFLNYVGRRIMQEIESKKNINGRKKLLPIVYYLHHTLGTIVKPRVLCNNLYSSLLYYLDELLFHEVKTLNTFVIEDESYPLSFVYFNTDDWSTEEHQGFVLDKGVIINESEAHLINSFIEDYETFVLELEGEIATMGRDERLTRKLTRIIARLKRRLIDLRVYSLRVISRLQPHTLEV